MRIIRLTAGFMAAAMAASGPVMAQGAGQFPVGLPGGGQAMAQLVDDALYLIDLAGRPVPAPDGAYSGAGGRARIVVQGQSPTCAGAAGETMSEADCWSLVVSP